MINSNIIKQLYVRVFGKEMRSYYRCKENINMTGNEKSVRVTPCKKEISIYIHIPFCVRKCLYCDFLSDIYSEEIKSQYIAALLREIKLTSDLLSSANTTVKTVFFGGGTPSAVPSKFIVNIMNELKQAFLFCKETEISIEVNPGTVSQEKLKDYRDCGVNRISIGLQSTVQAELEALGRIHTYDKFLETYNLARKVGFDNINIDIMSAIPRQTKESYKLTLERVVSLKPQHISAYSLIIEENTPFYKKYQNLELQKELVDEDTERQLYYMTREYLESKGYHQYEISNYAQDRYECEHNKVYWSGGDYLGFGVGAASFFDGYRYANISDIEQYIELIKKLTVDKLFQKDTNLRAEFHKVTPKEAKEEFMFLGLRLIEGISVHEFEQRFSCNYCAIYGDVTDRLLNEGFLKKTVRAGETFISLTNRGIDVSNSVLAYFLL